MKRLIYLILILLILPLIYAEQFQIIPGQTIDYKGFKIKLSSIGTSGSLNMKINGLSRVLEKDSSLEIYSLNIKFVNSSLLAATIDITYTGSCLINQDCEDNKDCTRDICRNNLCLHIPESGCLLNDECRSQLSLGEVNNVLSYCGMDNEWHSRKELGTECFNNAECLSNLCKENLCKEYEEVTKMAPSWILIVFGAVLSAGGLFVLAPRLAKKIIKNLISNFSDNSWRIFFLIELLIGIALITLALI